MNDNLYSLFESRFPADRNQPLLLLGPRGSLTYAEAEATSARFASLLASLGLVPGDRIAVPRERRDNRRAR
jgi:malonyl-CoA/methylmalonyl-CoA synthetase